MRLVVSLEPVPLFLIILITSTIICRSMLSKQSYLRAASCKAGEFADSTEGRVVLR